MFLFDQNGEAVDVRGLDVEGLPGVGGVVEGEGVVVRRVIRRDATLGSQCRPTRWRAVAERRIAPCHWALPRR